jgi:tRNA threonylcarbamoyladenosine biosynthesis protein TsaE
MIEQGLFLTDSAEATFELAYRIGESIETTTVFLLEGDLGAGKTVFAKGLAAGLGIDPAEVSSPTFTLVNHYQGRLQLFHLDLYRLSGREIELRELGIEEMVAERDALIVIEWPERLGSHVPLNAYRIKIFDEGGESRKISIVRTD